MHICFRNSGPKWLVFNQERLYTFKMQLKPLTHKLDNKCKYVTNGWWMCDIILQSAKPDRYQNKTIIYFCWFDLFWCSGTGKLIQAHKGTDKLSWTRRELNPRHPDWGNTANCQLTSTIASCHWNCLKINTIPMTCLRLHWTTDNPSGMHRSYSTSLGCRRQPSLACHAWNGKSPKK